MAPEDPENRDPAPPPTEVTRILRAATDGDTDAAERLFPVVYDQLRSMARGYLRQERADHTLQATALVHEAYLKLVSPEGTDWENRAHFFGVAARAMRQILVNHAKSHSRLKRGGDRGRVPLTDTPSPASGESGPVDLVALDRALANLAEVDPRKAQLVELRFFGGLTVEQAAEMMQTSPRTARREWTFAKTWLRSEIDRINADA